MYICLSVCYLCLFCHSIPGFYDPCIHLVCLITVLNRYKWSLSQDVSLFFLIVSFESNL